jgi:hypothetical protein
MIAAVLGWVGTIGTMVAYFLVSRGRLRPDSARYATLNAAGGTLGAAASALYQAWPSVASNVVWAVIGLRTLVQVAGMDYARPRWTRRPAAAPEPTDAQGENPCRPATSDPIDCGPG